MVDRPEVRTAKRDFVVSGTEYREEQRFAPREAAAVALTQGWLQILGPVTAGSLGALLQVEPALLYQSVLAMELQGIAMRGIFEQAKPADDAVYAIEWCERRILQRVHRLTLGTLRKQIEPVAPAAFMDWLFDWQHVAPQAQLAGEEGVLAAIEQLEGFEAPAVEWERALLPARVAQYDPAWLDNLCLAGVIGWGRVSPHPAWTQDGEAPRRVIPTSAAPITFFLREGAAWLHHALAEKCVEETVLAASLSPQAQALRSLLGERGAAFTADLQRLAGLTKIETTNALWELATAGLAAADGFDQMRAMMDPRRKTASIEQTAATSLRKRAFARTTAGRWSLLCDPSQKPDGTQTKWAQATDAQRERAVAAAKSREAALDAHARILLTRYGVLFRELLARESNAPKWRDLVPVLRRLEARGEIRGGRFVSGPFGEQYALNEAVESLRAVRRAGRAAPNDRPARLVTVAAADPLNLVGILVPGERAAAIPGRSVGFADGVPAEDFSPPAARRRLPLAARARSIVELIRADASAPRPNHAASTPGLFQ